MTLASYLLVPTVLVYLWHVAAVSLAKFYLPTPLAAVTEVVNMITLGDLGLDIAASLTRLFVGLSISIPLGLIVGTVLGYFTLVNRIVYPTINWFRMLPVTALVPLVIVAMGFSEQSAIFIILLAAFFPTLIATIHATKGVKEEYADLISNLELSPVRNLTKIILPGALPGSLAGIDLSINAAFRMMIVAELFGAPNGLGFRLMESSHYLNFSRVFGLLLVIGTIGAIISGSINQCKFYILRRFQ